MLAAYIGAEACGSFNEFVFGQRVSPHTAPRSVNLSPVLFTEPGYFIGCITPSPLAWYCFGIGLCA